MKVDVIVVGGGLVGFATALLLSQAGFEICILDTYCPDSLDRITKSSPYELRVSAITPHSVKLFKKMGIWLDILNVRVGYFEKIKIIEGSEEEAEIENKNNFLFKTQGYIIENKIIQQSLLEKINNQKNINFLAPVEIKSIQKLNNNIIIKLNNDLAITAKLIVGADGANSKIREWAELGLTTKDYNQSALVGIIQTEKSHENMARQKFLPEGPLAFLPLDQKNYCSIVWTHSPETAQNLLNCSESEFNKILQKSWGDELGKLIIQGPRGVFKLSKKHAKNYIAERIALVGDAAHVIHPLAGQGVNLGFLDAQKLTEILGQLKFQKRDIGLYNNLRKYELARKSDNSIIQNLMDVFNLEWVRKLGFKLTRNSDLVKKMMVSWMENREKIE